MGSSSAAPWKHLLLTSIQANSHLRHHSYVQLATVSSTGKPSNRTVVFRGFQDDSDKILINTDTRSRKIDELKHCPFAEVCWYFTDSWEQFRISGTVDIIDGTNPNPAKLEERERSWFASSLKSRLQYMAPTPGLPCVDGEGQGQPFEMGSSLDPRAGPVAAFCLLVLEADQVDYLNLKSNQRVVFSSAPPDHEMSKFWASEKINP
ncbi:pyridoxine/pyridoxamine 5'-phosphate oxidase 2 [Andrographis paniculata]|uniref:pyridoxine/pyridoxamine 5'-phosphate oxidase 2 n=1 Tax=Andrographis paniculata TaxID=175694 RepID=UPI0021E71CB6|nr:pyridoxine/pyridoxamine 5'-phosphate oxidase 2 [Andrographis paniculata]